MTTSVFPIPATLLSGAPIKVKFERIYVPTDFTDVSQNALEYAKSIAKFYGSTILLAHVSEPFNPVTPPEVVWFDQFTTQIREEEQLESTRAELQSHGLQARTIRLSGVVQQEILASAVREQADLIVMGSHARTGLPRFFLGSEAESLFRHAHCPILVVGPRAKPVSVPNLVGPGPWLLTSIVCASSFDPASAPAAAYAARLARDHGATLTLLHVDDSEGKVNKDLQISHFENALNPLLGGDPKPVYLWRALMLGYTVGAAIADVAFERNSGLILMGAHEASSAKTHLPRGIAPQVLAKAECPVMVMPGSSSEDGLA